MSLPLSPSHIFIFVSWLAILFTHPLVHTPSLLPSVIHSLTHSKIPLFIFYIIQTTEHRDFRERWQIERGILEGEGSSSVDLLEEFICSGDYTTSTHAIVCMYVCVCVCRYMCLHVRVCVIVCIYVRSWL